MINTGLAYACPNKKSRENINLCALSSNWYLQMLGSQQYWVAPENIIGQQYQDKAMTTHNTHWQINWLKHNYRAGGIGTADMAMAVPVFAWKNGRRCNYIPLVCKFPPSRAFPSYLPRPMNVLENLYGELHADACKA